MNEELNESICIYFIENHIATCSPIISFPNYYGRLLGKLEKEKDKIFLSPEKNEQFIYSIYHFEIYPEKIKERKKDKLQIKLILENDNQKFNHKLIITELDKNNYIFDLEFEIKGIFHDIYPPKSYKFTRSTQFEIYSEYLKKELGLKKNNNKKREDLVFFAQKLLEQKFMFNFYIIVFIDCAFSKNFIRHFYYFNPNNLEGTGDITKYQKISKTYIDIIRKKHEKILSDFKTEKEREFIYIKLFSFILYFYYEYVFNEFPKILENEDEEIKYYINNVLLNYSYLFIKQKLSKERVQELINISKTYNKLSNALQYINSIYELLEMVESNFQIFKQFYKADINKSTIDIEQIISPRKEDDIKK